MELLPWLLFCFSPWLHSPGQARRNDKFAQNWTNLHKLQRSRSPIKRQTALANSPIHYIALPPNPYSFVPGLGFLSPAAKPQLSLTSPDYPTFPNSFISPSSSSSSSSSFTLTPPTSSLPPSHLLIRTTSSDITEDRKKAEDDNSIPDSVSDIPTEEEPANAANNPPVLKEISKKRKKTANKKNKKRKKLKPSKVFTYKMPSHITLETLQQMKKLMVNKQEKDILRPNITFLNNGKPFNLKMMKGRPEKEKKDKEQKKEEEKEEKEKEEKEEEHRKPIMKPSKLLSMKDKMKFSSNGKPHRIYLMEADTKQKFKLKQKLRQKLRQKQMTGENMSEVKLKSAVNTSLKTVKPGQTLRLQHKHKLAASIGTILGNLIKERKTTITTTTITTTTTTTPSPSFPRTEGALDRIFSDSLSVSRVITSRPVRRRVPSNSPVRNIKVPLGWNLGAVFQSFLRANLGVGGSGTQTTTTTTTPPPPPPPTTTPPNLPRQSPVSWISGLTNGLPRSLILTVPELPGMSWIHSSLIPATRAMLG